VRVNNVLVVPTAAVQRGGQSGVVQVLATRRHHPPGSGVAGSGRGPQHRDRRRRARGPAGSSSPRADPARVGSAGRPSGAGPRMCRGPAPLSVGTGSRVESRAIARHKLLEARKSTELMRGPGYRRRSRATRGVLIRAIEVTPRVDRSTQCRRSPLWFVSLYHSKINENPAASRNRRRFADQL